MAGYVCNVAKAGGQMIKAGDNSTFIQKELYYQPGENAYVFDVYWKDGCKSTVTQRNAFNPMGGDFNCTSLFERDYKQCKSLDRVRRVMLQFGLMHL